MHDQLLTFMHNSYPGQSLDQEVAKIQHILLVDKVPQFLHFVFLPG